MKKRTEGNLAAARGLLISTSGEEEQMAEPISIVLTGDVMPGRGVDEAVRRCGAFSPWGNMVTRLKVLDRGREI